MVVLDTVFYSALGLRILQNTRYIIDKVHRFEQLGKPEVTSAIA